MSNDKLREQFLQQSEGLTFSEYVNREIKDQSRRTFDAIQALKHSVRAAKSIYKDMCAEETRELYANLSRAAIGVEFSTSMLDVVREELTGLLNKIDKMRLKEASYEEKHSV